MNNQSKLSDIKKLTFIGGQIISRIEADAKKNEIVIGKVQVILPKSIKGGKIEHNELYVLKYKTELDEKKLTKEGDIVVKLSSPYDAAYITKEDEGLLITSFCIIIRNTGENIYDKYFATFLNSQVYLNQVKSMVSGAQVPMLTIGKVKEVFIKMLPLEEQKQIAEYYENICEKEIVMAQIIELEKEKLNAVLGGNWNG
jgi:restriction endonuclease S subunit